MRSYAAWLFAFALVAVAAVVLGGPAGWFIALCGIVAEFVVALAVLAVIRRRRNRSG